jgi:spore germination cell wall hydrolase CwlJ-like protein
MVIRSLLLAASLFIAVNVPVAHAQSQSDAYCLALAAFTEARDQGEHGMALVAHTVLNRAVARQKSACKVAYAPHQFVGVLTWPKNLHPAQKNAKAWSLAMSVSIKVMRGEWIFTKCKGAHYFYAPKEMRNGRVPRWAKVHPFLCEHRGHRFYGSL